MRAGLLAVSLLVLGPQHVLANHFTSVRFEVEPKDLVVTLDAKTPPLGKPRLRIGRGRIKVWFPDMRDVERYDGKGDGRAIRDIKVRPGMRDTGVLQIELGRRIRLPAAAVQLVPTEKGAQVRIKREALPKARTAPSVPVAAPEELSRALVETKKETERVEPSPEQALFGKQEPDQRPSTGSTAVAGRPDGTQLGVLAVVSLVLGVIYGFIRLFQARRGRGERLPEIEVLGARRIGTRHQLLLVRALGQEHLLSVNAGHTERLSSTPIGGFPTEGSWVGPLPAPPMGAPQAPAEGSWVGPLPQAPTAQAPATPAQPSLSLRPSRPDNEDSQVAKLAALREMSASRGGRLDGDFGAELLSFVRSSEGAAEGETDPSQPNPVARWVRLGSRAAG